MIVKDVIPVDFVNYKEPAMYVAFPYCSFKCEKECGIKCCQNSELYKSPNIEVSAARIVEIYKAEAQPIAKALVCCGMEPFDSFADLLDLIVEFRNYCTDPVIVYTGYTEEEASTYIEALRQFPNILVKFGRFRPNQPHHVDELLGVELVNPEQYCKKISQREVKKLLFFIYVCVSL